MRIFACTALLDRQSECECCHGIQLAVERVDEVTVRRLKNDCLQIPPAPCQCNARQGRWSQVAIVRWLTVTPSATCQSGSGIKKQTPPRAVEDKGEKVKIIEAYHI